MSYYALVKLNNNQTIIQQTTTTSQNVKKKKEEVVNICKHQKDAGCFESSTTTTDGLSSASYIGVSFTPQHDQLGWGTTTDLTTTTHGHDGSSEMVQRLFYSGADEQTTITTHVHEDGVVQHTSTHEPHQTLLLHQHDDWMVTSQQWLPKRYQTDDLLKEFHPTKRRRQQRLRSLAEFSYTLDVLGNAGWDFYQRKHVNGLTVVGLAKSHAVFDYANGVYGIPSSSSSSSSVEDKQTNHQPQHDHHLSSARLTLSFTQSVINNQVSGKKKRDALRVSPQTILANLERTCTFSSNNNIRTEFDIPACLPGDLLDYNDTAQRDSSWLLSTNADDVWLFILRPCFKSRRRARCLQWLPEEEYSRQRVDSLKQLRDNRDVFLSAFDHAADNHVDPAYNIAGSSAGCNHEHEKHRRLPNPLLVGLENG